MYICNMKCYKKSFETQGIAEVIIDEMVSNGIKDAKLLSTYQCDECYMWHLTSRQKN